MKKELEMYIDYENKKLIIHADFGSEFSGNYRCLVAGQFKKSQSPPIRAGLQMETTYRVPRKELMKSQSPPIRAGLQISRKRWPRKSMYSSSQSPPIRAGLQITNSVRCFTFEGVSGVVSIPAHQSRSSNFSEKLL